MRIRESTQIMIAFLITLSVLIVIFVISFIQSNVASMENMLSILLAFTLGMLMTEFGRVWYDEKRTDDILSDLLEETREIREHVSTPKPGKLYLATWSLIKSSGMPARINPKLRKKLAEAFLQLEIYNDDVQRYEDYSITSDFDENIEKNLEAIAEQSKEILLEQCEIALKLANALGKMKS